MEAIDKIKRGAGGSGMVREPDRVISMKLGTAAAPAAEAGGGVDSAPAQDA
jgi:peptidylprolyl isomerase